MNTNFIQFMIVFVFYSAQYVSNCEPIHGNHSTVSSEEESPEVNDLVREYQERAEAMCREADGLRDEADRMREEADRLGRDADMIHWTANTLNPEGDETLRHLEEEETIRREADNLIVKGDGLRAKADEMVDKANKLNEEAVELLGRVKHLI